MINRIGVRGHDYGQLSPEDLTKALVHDGYNAVHLALRKSFGDQDAYLNEGSAERLGMLFYEHDIALSVLGCYLNYGQIDDDKREANILTCFKHIELAKAFNAKCIASETFTLNSDNKPHEGDHSQFAYKRIVDAFSMLLAKAEENGVDFAVEAVAGHIINTPEKLREFVASIDSPALKIIFDPVNLITPENYLEQETMISNMVEWFSDRIVVLHAKDFVIEKGVKKIVAPGEGLLNYKHLMAEIKAMDNPIDVIAEGIPSDSIASTAQFLKGWL